jgi:acyl carrier protein
MALTEAQLIGYLRDSLSVDGNLDPDSELFSNGALDSVAMLSLISFVEEKSGIEIRPEHVTLDNFDTPGRIVRFAEGLS